MDESARHAERWRDLHREVIRGLEEEVEALRLRLSDLEQAAQEREGVLLELLEIERASRPAAEVAPATSDVAAAPPSQTEPARARDAGARNAERMSRLAPRIPELEAALRAREEELEAMRNRKVLRAIHALVMLKRRLVR